MNELMNCIILIMKFMLYMNDMQYEILNYVYIYVLGNKGCAYRKAYRCVQKYSILYNIVY